MLTVHARPAVVAGNARAPRASARVVAGAATARVAPAKSPALSFRTASLGSAGAVRAAPRPARVRRAVAATASAGNAVTFSAADLGEAPKSGASFVWKGAKLQAAALSVGVGLAVQFLIPCPGGGGAAGVDAPRHLPEHHHGPGLDAFTSRRVGVSRAQHDRGDEDPDVPASLSRR
jgi:hypothetical protein